MAVADSDLIHVDQHWRRGHPRRRGGSGPDGRRLIAPRERVIIDAARKPDLSVEIEKLNAAWRSVVRRWHASAMHLRVQQPAVPDNSW